MNKGKGNHLFNKKSSKNLQVSAKAGNVYERLRINESQAERDCQQSQRELYSKVHVFTNSTIAILAAQVDKDGRMLITANESGIIHVWNLETKILEAEVKGQYDCPIIALILNFSATRLIAGGRDGVVKIFETKNFKVLSSLPPWRFGINCFALDSEETMLFVGEEQGGIVVYDLSRLAKLK